MNGSLVPANAKKSMLIAGFLRPVPDLVVALTGIFVTICILLAVNSSEFLPNLLGCIPALICIFLVLPIPKYHNMMCAIADIFNFYFKRRRYKWKGWCIDEEFKD